MTYGGVCRLPLPLSYERSGQGQLKFDFVNRVLCSSPLPFLRHPPRICLPARLPCRSRFVPTADFLCIMRSRLTVASQLWASQRSPLTSRRR